MIISASGILQTKLTLKFNTTMATNPPKGDGRRQGAVRQRSQVLNPLTDRWTKRDSETGRFMDQKADPKPFRGVRRER